MHNISTAELVQKVGSSYKLVVLAALRAIELSEGAANLIGARPEAKTINVALREIVDGKISYKIKEKK